MENNAIESVAVCSLIKSYFYDPSPEELAENCVMKAKPGDKYYGMSKESLLKNWNQKREEGINIHKLIEKDFENSVVYEYIKKYLDNGFIKYDELNISLQTKKYLIKGRTDCVLINIDNKKIIICEWKNCRYYNLKSDNKGFGPCTDLYNTKFTKHVLQSQFYKVMLKNQYPDFDIIAEVVYLNDKKIDKIVTPHNLAVVAVQNILNHLNE